MARARCAEACSGRKARSSAGEGNEDDDELPGQSNKTHLCCGRSHQEHVALIRNDNYGTNLSDTLLGISERSLFTWRMRRTPLLYHALSLADGIDIRAECERYGSSGAVMLRILTRRTRCL